MGLSAHLKARVAAFVLGFFGGFLLFVFLIFGKPHGNFHLTALLFFGLIFGGGYLAQLGFANLFPAACPKCGARSAVPELRKPLKYTCRSCGAQPNAAMALFGGEAAFRQMAEVQAAQPQQGRKLLWIFLLVGVIAAGVGAWLAADTVRLVRGGVSVSAQVMKVTMSEGRDSDGNTELRYTAQIHYKIGATPTLLERSWSVKPGSRCFAGCYDQGEMLRVRYLPGEPGTARVDSFGDLYLKPGIPLLVGLLFIAFGVLMLRRKP